MSKERKKRRIRWGRLLGALIFIGVFMVGLYHIYQYIQGSVKTALNQPLQNVAANHEVKGQTVDLEEDKKMEEVNVLLLGSDSRGEKQSRTDTIMVAHYNPDLHQIKLISLMRDMYVTIPGHGQQKLNAAYAFGGTELLRQTIKENFGLDIQYYAIIDFKGFEKAIDLLVPNGIEVDIPHEMSDGIGMTLVQGKQRLHGKELLGYVRFRHDRLSDFGRVQRQQEVISKVKDEAISLNNVVKLPELLKILNTYLETNINTSTLLTIGKDMLTNKSGAIETLRIPENGSFENKRLDDVGDVLEVDLPHNKEVLNNFIATTQE